MKPNLSNLRNVLGPRVNTGIFLAQKHSPEIMLATGIVSGLSGAIWLAKNHKKAEEEFKDIFERRDEIKKAVEEANMLAQLAPDETRPITKQEEMRAYMPIYLEFGKRAVLLYGPPVALGVLSILMVVGGHGILRRRNQALLSTVFLLERSFNAYRERVREELGKDGDDRFYYGLERRKQTVITTDESGKKKKTKTEENVLGEEISPIMYQYVFDDTNRNWSTSERSAHFWLGVQQKTFQTELESRGHIMLNTVLKELGFDETPIGALVGWSLNAPGDDYVDLGVMEPWNQNRADGSILLNFNVNGPVWPYINRRTLLG